MKKIFQIKRGKGNTSTLVDSDALLLSDNTQNGAETDQIFQNWLNTNPLANFLTTETDPAFQQWLSTNPLNGFLTSVPDATETEKGLISFQKVREISGRALIQVPNLTLVVANWALVSGLYEYNLTNENILSTSIVDVIPDNTSISIVRVAQILPQTVATNGSVKIYALNLPTGSIGITINIF